MVFYFAKVVFSLNNAQTIISITGQANGHPQEIRFTICSSKTNSVGKQTAMACRSLATEEVELPW